MKAIKGFLFSPNGYDIIKIEAGDELDESNIALIKAAKDLKAVASSKSEVKKTKK